jgi:hypothetical protein
LKTDFRARPVYLSRDDRIKAHFMTCFLSLTIYRYLEKRLKEEFTSSEIIGQLRDMNFYAIPGEGYIPTYTRTDFTDALHDAFGFRTDYQIVTLKQMKKILRIPKSKKSTHFFMKAKSLERPIHKASQTFSLLQLSKMGD